RNLVDARSAVRDADAEGLDRAGALARFVVGDAPEQCMLGAAAKQRDSIAVPPLGACRGVTPVDPLFEQDLEALFTNHVLVDDLAPSARRFGRRERPPRLLGCVFFGMQQLLRALRRVRPDLVDQLPTTGAT